MEFSFVNRSSELQRWTAKDVEGVEAVHALSSLHDAVWCHSSDNAADNITKPILGNSM